MATVAQLGVCEQRRLPAQRDVPVVRRRDECDGRRELAGG
jgi:hypothetical protein